MKTIDWNRPYGKICGSVCIPGARYTQDDLYFNPKGLEVKMVEMKPPEQSLTKQCQDFKAQGLTDTEIGERLGITRQKVTKLLC